MFSYTSINIFFNMCSKGTLNGHDSHANTTTSVQLVGAMFSFQMKDTHFSVSL